MFTPEVPQSGGSRRHLSSSSPRAGGGGSLISYTLSPNAVMSEEELDNVMENFASEDNYVGKTWSRIVVEKFLMKYSWYFPLKDLKNPPSLSKAYAYYEHISLPRHFVGEAQADHVQRRAEPGETQATELYSPFKTPSSVFVEWGIGVDLYFSTLLIMALVLFIAGLIHLPNLIFYRSEDYGDRVQNLPWSLHGSAICTTFEWVACLDCTEDQFWNSAQEQQRIGFTNGTVLVQRNDCEGGRLPQGVVNLAALGFLTVIFLLLSIYLGAREVRFDEDKVTSTDYSILVKNPPKDAYDPDEWRDFFSQFAEKQVTAVTIALNNETMLRKLIARRTHRNNLRLKLPKGTNMDNEDEVRAAVLQLVRDRDLEVRGCLWKLFDCTVLPILHIFNMLLPAETLVDKVFQLTDEIKELQTDKYEVSKVFVTFETEEGQRAALSALSIGRLDIMMDNKAACAPSCLFKGHILNVGEPSEPSAVRWLDLSASTIRKGCMRGLNLTITIAIVSFAGYLVALARYNIGAWASGPLISIFNSIIPMIVKILMIFEPHGTEGSFQASLYMKITLFRWVNTALLVKLLTPWTSTLSDAKQDVLPQVNALLWSELWLVPLLRLSDLFGNFKKHVLAPRSRTQEAMNLNFQGTKYNLGERYTDLTKVLFVCFFFSALYPAAFFFGAAILIVQYMADKFCLMRIWAPSPFVGSEVAQFSRRYFMSGAILAYAIISAYAFAGFPYDNLCDVTDDPTIGAAGTYNNVEIASDDVKEPETIVVTQDEFVVSCRQNWRGFSGLPFPPTSRSQPAGFRWMGDSQEMLTDIYGWTAVAFLIGFIVLFFGSGLLKYFRSWFRGVYEPSGQKQEIDFSANTEIFGYVPQVKISGFPFPFICCDIDQIDQGLIGWNDPTHSYDHHNLIFDVPWKGMPRTKIIVGNTRSTGVIREQSDYHVSSENRPFNEAVAPEELAKPHLFSTVKHYPPKWKRELFAENLRNNDSE